MIKTDPIFKIKFMYEEINEPIDVLVGFNKKQVKPIVFRWRNKKYMIDRINLVHSSNEGKSKIYYFSVTDNANYFKLRFNSEELDWKLVELYYSG